jgi:phenylalanyl-tRNA synthetase alpha subunit
MDPQLTALLAEARAAAPALASRPEFEAFKARYSGPKGAFTGVMKSVGKLPPAERPIAGKLINQFKQHFEALYAETLARLETAELTAQLGPAIDPTLPAPAAAGLLHPLTQARREVCALFRKVGFTLAEGPELETEWFNFDALNTPADHPARNEQDTFYLPEATPVGNVTRSDEYHATASLPDLTDPASFPASMIEGSNITGLLQRLRHENRPRPIHIPEHMVEPLNKVTLAQKHLLEELGREPTVQEMATAMQWPFDRMEVILKLLRVLKLETGQSDARKFPVLKFPAVGDEDTAVRRERYLLRSHTSTVQIRTLLKEKPPLRVLAPGRTFRRDNVDATHSANFHQVEGLCVDRRVTIVDLKAALDYLVRGLFGPGAQIRLRPSFFPFTEPSFELDFQSPDLGRLSNKWLELGGCGLVDPEVFKACNLDPAEWTGYAFGFGLERIAMVRAGIDDIRHFYQNDLRFLRQFA